MPVVGIGVKRFNFALHGLENLDQQMEQVSQ